MTAARIEARRLRARARELARDGRYAEARALRWRGFCLLWDALEMDRGGL